MKNLMIYVSPTGSFDNPRPDLTSNDATSLVKVQVDNSLELGWKMEDLMLVTNFAYEYRGLKALVLKGVEFFNRKPQASKINAIVKLFDNNLIVDHELYWFHDLDAFQIEPIGAAEINIREDEIALTDFGGAKRFGGENRWSTGVIYFKSGAKDIFERMKKKYYEKQIDEEEALGLLVINDPQVRKRVKKINCAYNFIGFNLRSCWEKSIKPLKVAHLHPDGVLKRLGPQRQLDFFIGDNELHRPLITERLVDIFNRHGIK